MKRRIGRQKPHGESARIPPSPASTVRLGYSNSQECIKRRRHGTQRPRVNGREPGERGQNNLRAPAGRQTWPDADRCGNWGMLATAPRTLIYCQRFSGRGIHAIFVDCAHSSARIEHLPSKQRVAGSNPAGRTIYLPVNLRLTARPCIFVLMQSAPVASELRPKGPGRVHFLAPFERSCGDCQQRSKRNPKSAGCNFAGSEEGIRGEAVAERSKLSWVSSEDHRP